MLPYGVRNNSSDPQTFSFTKIGTFIAFNCVKSFCDIPSVIDFK